MPPPSTWPRPGEHHERAAGDGGPGPGPGREDGGRRRRIAIALLGALVALVALVVWVVLVPYPASTAPIGGRFGGLDCDADVRWGTSPTARRLEARFDEVCDAPRRDRRNTALVIGGVVVVIAAVASTWPSRRLTGEALGPEDG